MTKNPGTMSCDSQSPDWQQAVCEMRSHRGATLFQLSVESPVLVVFLRHTGCVFCREALADLSRQRAMIEGTGARLALVHMSEPLSATLRFERYSLGDVHRYSDPERVLYRAFGLDRGSLQQLFGAWVWWRALVAAVQGGHWFGRLEGDVYQMPGVFLLNHGRIMAEHRSASAADRPDYVDIAQRSCAAAERSCTPSDASTSSARHSA